MRIKLGVLLGCMLLVHSSSADEDAAPVGPSYSLADSATNVSAIPVTPDLLAPVEGGGAARAAGVDLVLGGTNEETVAVNPTDSQNVAAASLFQLRVSTNGGASFGAIVSPVVDSGSDWCGDPSLAFDSQGRLFWTYLGCAYDPLGNFLGIDLYLAQCNPATGAILAGYPVNITASLGMPATNGFEHDKEWLAADASPTSPFKDNLYVVWTEFAPAGTNVLTTTSTDQGLTWSAPLTLSGAGENFVWPVHNTVAPNGDVYAAYHDQSFTICCGACRGHPNGTSGRVFVLRSTNGGGSYPQKTQAYTAGQADMTFNVQTSAATIAQTQFWLQGSVQPWVLADPNTPGRIYVVSNDDPDNNPLAGDPADVFITISTDDGQNWSTPSRIDSGPGSSFQVMPTAAIDKDTGCIVVHYYDNRNGATNGAGNFLLDVFYTVSQDQGVSFSPDIQINDNPFDPDLAAGCRWDCSPGGLCPFVPTLRIGEYNGAAIDGEVFHAVWAGNGAGQDMIYDNVPEACDVGGFKIKFSQPPTGKGEDIPSNIDWTDDDPNVVVADDFISDGRPIDSVRWWGSEIAETAPVSSASDGAGAEKTTRVIALESPTPRGAVAFEELRDRYLGMRENAHTVANGPRAVAPPTARHVTTEDLAEHGVSASGQYGRIANGRVSDACPATNVGTLIDGYSPPDHVRPGR